MRDWMFWTLIVAGLLMLAIVLIPIIMIPPAQPMGSLGRPVHVGAAYVLPTVDETVRPPLVRQGDARAVVEFIDPRSVEARCILGGPGALACTRMDPERPTIFLPNPCAFPWDAYAVLACHEVGHVNGWEHAPAGVL